MGLDIESIMSIVYPFPVSLGHPWSSAWSFIKYKRGFNDLGIHVVEPSGDKRRLQIGFQRCRHTRGGTVKRKTTPANRDHLYPDSLLFVSAGFLPRVSSISIAATYQREYPVETIFSRPW